jgi:hypothetical protein
MILKHTIMKITCTKLLLLAMLSTTFFAGCEKQEMLMSKEKITKQLTYTWTKLMTPQETTVTWQFKDGYLYLRYNGELRAQGNYKVECSLTKVKIKIDGFSTGYDYLNLTWQVISLDDAGLVITDLEKGTQEYEFSRND